MQHHLLGRLDRERRAGEDLVDERTHSRVEVRRRHDLVDEPDPTRLGGVDAAAGEDESHRLLHRDRAREALQRAAPQRGQAHPRLRKPELRVVGGDREVAGGDDLDAPAQAMAVHRGDHRLEEVEALGDAGEAAIRILVGAGLRERLEIGADAERALPGPGDHRHPQVGVGRVEVERARELDMGGQVQ